MCPTAGLQAEKQIHCHSRYSLIGPYLPKLVCVGSAVTYCSPAGPLPKTIVDFWRLVWQEKPPTIVMVTNLKEGTKIKCQQYWPESGTKSFGPFEVTISGEQILADYTTRSLLVQVCVCMYMHSV